MTNNIQSTSKSEETRAFLFLTIFLAPIIAVGLVGGYGLLVWMSQAL